MAQFSTLYQEVLRRNKTDVTGQAETTTQAKLAVNGAQRRLQTMRRWNSLFRATSFETTNGTAAYTLDIRSVPGILWHEENGVPEEIKLISSLQWVRASQDIDAAAKPRVYYLTASSISSYRNALAIKLWPVPNSSSYTIYDSYYARATDMSADADVPTFPSEFDELLIMMGTYTMNLNREDVKVMLALKGDISELTRELIHWDDLQVPDPMFVKMRQIITRRTEQDAFDLPIGA